MKVLIVIAAVAACVVSFPGNGMMAKITTIKDLYSSDGSRIISGKPASYEQFPWQVAVHFTTPDGNHFCGGSLISDQWVLTAAHCTDHAKNFTLRFGGLTLNPTEEDRVDVEVNNYIQHPGYNSNLNFDAALIKLDSPIKLNNRIRPVKLAKRGQVVGAGEKLTVSGWGRTSDESWSISNTLNFVELTTISNEECTGVYGNGIVTDETVCCRGNPEHSTCNGDSGGPLVIYENGDATHVGTVCFIHIDGCASGQPSGFTRTESILPWIAEITGLNV